MVSEPAGSAATAGARPPPVLVLLAVNAIALPALLAFNLPPSSTFLNQAAALVGWGALLAVLAASMPPAAVHASPGARALQTAFAVLSLAALAAPLWAGAPWSLALSAAGLIVAAALAAWVGMAAQQARWGGAAFRAVCLGLLVAGVASSLIGIVQVYVPAWADGDWIAPSGMPGRAVSNMRQPNHMSSLLLWALIATAWLGEATRGRRASNALAIAAAMLMLFGLVLSGSRTGALGTLILTGWGLLDRGLSRRTRVLLLLAPVLYALMWWGAAAWSHHSHQVFGGEAQLNKQGDISSSRFGIWANTLSLIASHPWFGVGFGEFNFAWTLTPFPGRPVAFFDHTHNLPLQLAVELGLPLAALVMVLLLWALYTLLMHALRAPAGVDGESPSLHRAAFVMVLMVLLHSLLEYPLWYAYFLLPAAFVFGLGLEQTGAAAAPQATDRPAHGKTRPVLVASMLVMLVGLLSVVDYLRVAAIFAPTDNAAPLAQRIAEGRRSWFFAHHADYAATTTIEHPSDAMPAFARATHYLLDARLMQAWAKALNESGKTEEARFVAQRLKEFRNEQATEFFDACTATSAEARPPPFQCAPPARAFGYEDFR